jgi:hypothetical protein
LQQFIMPIIDHPTYVLDFRDIRSCHRIQDANPGESVTVTVRPESDEVSPGCSAQGSRTVDGHLFEIIVTTEQGEQSHSWTWGALMDAIRVHKGTIGVRR